MLLREDFRRRHQRPLKSVFHREQQSCQRHRRLARPHVALQQPRHRVELLEVAEDLVDHALLRRREIEGQALAERREQGALDLVGEAFGQLARLAALERPGQLEQQQLLVGQARARRLQLPRRAGEVDGVQRLGGRELLALLEQRRGDGVLGVRGRLLHGGEDGLAHEALGKPLRQRIDRGKTADMNTPTFIGERVMLVDMHFMDAGETGLRPSHDPDVGARRHFRFKGREHVEAPAAVLEPDRLERAARRRELGFVERQRRARRIEAGADDAPLRDDEAGRRRQSEVFRLMPVLPVARQVIKEVAQGAHPELGQDGGAARPHAFEVLDGQRQRRGCGGRHGLVRCPFEVITMAFKCSICSKGPVSGLSYSHSNRGTKRIFRPNLQKQKVMLAGRPQTAYVCANCIKSGKAVRPAK